MKGIFKKVVRSRSRKIVFSSALVTLVAVGGFLVLGNAPHASAATANGCTVGSGDATDSFDQANSTPNGINIPTTGTYALWLRMQSPDGTHNTLNVSIDGGACITMGATMSAGTWTWVDTTSGSSTQKTVSLTAGFHTMVITGNSGMELDEVQLLSDTTCVPPNTGNYNLCAQLAAEAPPTVSISAPTNNSTATTGSTVAISAAASDSIAVTQVVFKVDGTTIATDTSSPYTANWTATAGTHTITAVATDTGNQSTTSTPITITVNNPSCTGAPTAPTNLHNADTTTPANKVDLAWTAGSVGTNCTLAGYNIYRNGSTTPLNATPVNALTYSDTNAIAASTTYTYQIATVDNTGQVSTKVPSPALSITTGSNCAAGSGKPTTPAVTVGTTTYTTVPLTWTASTVNDGCTLSGYNVFRGTTQLNTSLLTTTSFTDTGIGLTPANLLSGTTYSYSVVAVDSGGNDSTAGTANATTKADNVAPSAPTGFTATAASAGLVNLSWTAATDLPNPGAVGVKDYEVFRCTGTSCVPTTSSTLVTTTTSTSYADTSVIASTAYTYAVEAIDNNNNVSSFSTDATVTTPAPTCSGNPTTPTGLSSPSQTVNSIDLSWTASTPAAGCTMQGYEVLRDHVQLPQIVTTTTYNDTGLTAGSHIYDLIAIDTSGHKSASTADFTQTTAPDTTPPSAPTNFVVSAPSPTQVSLSWTASTDNVAVAGYNLYRNGSTTPLNVGGVISGTTYTDNSVVANTTYTYLLEAVDTSGNKSSPKTASTPASITTPKAVDTTPPSTPGQPVAGAINSTSVALTWTASTDNVAVAGYNVFAGTTQENTSGLVSSPSFTITGLTPFTQYSITVVAVDTSGNKSAVSPALSVTTLNKNGCTNNLPADVTGDCHVNFSDLALFIQDYQTYNGKTVPTGTDGDIDNSGSVGFDDFSLFAQDYPLENGQ